jgi:uncharacterized protein YndB with AHSA1/START domain
MKSAITAETTVNAPIEKIWKLWNTAEDIMQWNNPSDEWYSSIVEIDLKEEGRFFFRMETKDGSVGFDHAGKYDKVIIHKLIEYTVNEGRKSIIVFNSNNDFTTITETFEPEPQTPIEMQKEFCQGVLNNFKKYAENK